MTNPRPSAGDIVNLLQAPCTDPAKFIRYLANFPKETEEAFKRIEHSILTLRQQVAIAAAMKKKAKRGRL